MRKFLYVCFVLPALSASAAKNSYPASKKGSIHLRSSSFVRESKISHKRNISKGNCYIFDGTKPVMTLTDVKYSMHPKKELVVDLKLKPSEQLMLGSLSKKIEGKRELVLMVNGNVVKTPKILPKSVLSKRSQSQVQALVSSLRKA